MKYQFVESIELNQKNALSKARNDVEKILEKNDFQKIRVEKRKKMEKTLYLSFCRIGKCIVYVMGK